jgi:hypothetical protein
VRETSRDPAPKRGEQGGQAWGGGVEVEELPAQSVLRRGSPRLGLGGTLVVAAIVALLAAGFGVLGGRPDASPGPSRAAIGPSGDGPAVEPPGSPLVTPWIDCEEPQSTVPNIFLQVDGVPIAGTVDIRDDGLGGPAPTSTGPGLPSLQPNRTDVPVDVTSEIWVEGAVCAVAWTIDLVDFDLSQNLDVVQNTTHDPSFASQNRFQLPLGAHGGGDYDLRAVFTFPTLVARATWPIRIVPVERPVAVLHISGGDVEPVLGCDVTLTLATGWTNDLNPCADDVGEPPVDDAQVLRGERLVFEIEGWRIDSLGGVVCGRLFGPSFRPLPQRDCEISTISDGELLIFKGPTGRGRSTLALSACATHEASAVGGLNRVCGTWYANVVVSE